MHRFFCSPENINKEYILINDKKEVHHIADVLRLRLNDSIVVFDGEGKEYNGIIKEIKRKYVKVKIISEKKLDKKKDINITLACAIPKKGGFDYIVEKATELGVDKIIPLETKRTIVSLGEERQKLKLNHWRQIAINACKQCKRNFIPEIEGVNNFLQIVSNVKNYDLCLFFCLEGRKRKIRDALKDFKKGKIIIFIGPEGDFTNEEIALAKKYGCRFACLGSRVLKVDTAAISVISIINSLFSI